METIGQCLDRERGFTRETEISADQGGATEELMQWGEFAVPCDMRKSHVALAGLDH